MTSTRVIRYITHPEAAGENERLVRAVYAELAGKSPDGLHYATLRLADGVTFVHIAVVDGDENPLLTMPAFGEFRRGAAGIYRLADPVQLPRAVVRPDERLPRGDDPRGITAHLGHVRELDPPGLGPEVPAQQLDLVTAHHHQRRGILADRPAQERHGRSAELGHA